MKDLIFSKNLNKKNKTNSEKDHELVYKSQERRGEECSGENRICFKIKFVLCYFELFINNYLNFCFFYFIIFFNSVF